MYDQPYGHTNASTKSVADMSGAVCALIKILAHFQAQNGIMLPLRYKYFHGNHFSKRCLLLPFTDSRLRV